MQQMSLDLQHQLSAQSVRGERGSSKNVRTGNNCY
jgi:hypothetical protein